MGRYYAFTHDVAYMKKHTTGEAAKALDVSFITIKRWIYTGKIRAQKDADGWWLIDDEELQRVKEHIGSTTKNLDQRILHIVEEKGVAYLRELQVGFEEESLHRDTYAALKRLTPTQLQTREEWGNRWYFPIGKEWSDLANLAKTKAELAKAYVNHPRRYENNSIVYLDYSEYLVERALLDAGFTVAARDTYYFNGNMYRPNDSAGRPSDIDFIAQMPSTGIYIGIQVKNRMEHPKLADVQQLLEICRTLHLRPIMVARIFHPLTFDIMKSNRGMAIPCKRYFLQPPFPHETFQALNQMGIPIGVYRRPPDFLVRAFIELPKRMAA
jgi:hypothetical protein